MIRTPVCDLLGIEHPIALGGMGSASSPAMTAAGNVLVTSGP